MRAKALHEAICRDLEPVDLYTARGDCMGCGECCSRFLPLSPYDMGKLSGYCERTDVRAYVYEGGIDMTCPFLTPCKTCGVYAARPEICREYRCDRHLRGEMRAPMFAGSMRITDMHDVVRELDLPVERVAAP